MQIFLKAVSTFFFPLLINFTQTNIQWETNLPTNFELYQPDTQAPKGLEKPTSTTDPEKSGLVKDKWSNENTINAFECFIAFLNLCFIIWLFRKQREDRKQDRRMAIDSYWYQDFFLTPNKERIEEFFEELSVNYAKLQNTGSNRTVTQKIKEEKNKFSQTVLEDLNAINPKLSAKLDAILNEFEDTISAEIIKFPNNGDFAPGQNEIKKFKVKLISNLYNEHHNFLKETN